METCIVFGCERPNGPEDVEVFHRGEPIGHICSEHIGSAKGLKLILTRDKASDNFKLINADEIPKPLD